MHMAEFGWACRHWLPVEAVLQEMKLGIDVGLDGG